ncbi:MAG TPA: hypothetical protein VM658_21300 [bacterium]|nr:hypothetical protein [bacterium]
MDDPNSPTNSPNFPLHPEISRGEQPMKFFWLFIPLLALCIVSLACAQRPSPEDVQKIAVLKTELEEVRSEVVAAEKKNSLLAGGLIKALVEARLEILKTTEALIQQRIHALETGATISIKVSGTEPNEELAARLGQEIETQLVELSKAQAEADKYSGGLLAVMKQATVATQEQTVAMLRQRYLAAKYGLPTVVLPATTGGASEQGIGAASPSTSPSMSVDVPSADVSAEIVSVKLLGKRFSNQNYQQFILLDMEFTAKGLDKPARAIKGVLNLQDLFGEPKISINWTIDELMMPGQTFVKKGTGFEYNQFIDSHNWVRSTDLQNMTASFVVMSILYQDGSRRDF